MGSCSNCGKSIPDGIEWCTQCSMTDAKGRRQISTWSSIGRLIGKNIYGLVLAFLIVSSKKYFWLFPWFFSIIAIILSIFMFIKISKKFWGGQVLLGGILSLLFTMSSQSPQNNSTQPSSLNTPKQVKKGIQSKNFKSTTNLSLKHAQKGDRIVPQRIISGNTIGQYIGFSNADYPYILIKEGDHTLKFISGNDVSISNLNVGDTVKVNWKKGKVRIENASASGGSIHDSIEQTIASSVTKI